MSNRIDRLVARLGKGASKTEEAFGNLSDEQWQMILYQDPPTWTVRDLAAHFLSAEEGLLRIARDVAAGGPGAPKGFDYDEYNDAEQARLAGIAPAELLSDLAAARRATISWVAQLDEGALGQTGHHPALGEVTLEDLINAIHGHQLMHIRDLQALLRTP
jgi:hypothetical protein